MMSGISRSFKVPTLVKRLKKHHGLPSFDWNLLKNQQELASGSFGTVYSARYGESDNAEKVVVKKLKGECIESKRRFLKEAEMLNSISHKNIPVFIGYSDNPHGLIMEYVRFNFSPFGVEKVVSNLADFYHYVDSEFNFNESFADVMPVCLKDIVAGIEYLHGQNIAHRDLKPNNILVSNQHYCDQNETSFARIYQECPIVCKVSDFGLSRSLDAQTQSILKSRTDEICRGTLVYMAPEIHTGRLAGASQDDLKMADIWSLGILAYAMVNPNLSYPYWKECESSDAMLNEDVMKDFMQKHQLPSHDPKYEVLRATEWWIIEDIYDLCAKFDPSLRPTALHVLRTVGFEESLVIQKLRVSQSSAIEQADLNFALNVNDISSTKNLNEHQIPPQNDGTNACTFLAISIGDAFMQEIAKENGVTLENLT